MRNMVREMQLQGTVPERSRPRVTLPLALVQGLQNQLEIDYLRLPFLRHKLYDQIKPDS